MLFSPKNTVIKSRIFSQDAPSIADCQMGWKTCPSTEPSSLLSLVPTTITDGCLYIVCRNENCLPEFNRVSCHCLKNLCDYRYELMQMQWLQSISVETCLQIPSLPFCIPHWPWESFTANANILLQTETYCYNANRTTGITLHSHKLFSH
jgi:hypothetical protein